MFIAIDGALRVMSIASQLGHYLLHVATHHAADQRSAIECR